MTTEMTLSRTKRGRGRPRIPPASRRVRQVQIRLTPDEMRAGKRLADDRGVPLAEFMRSLLQTELGR